MSSGNSVGAGGYFNSPFITPGSSPLETQYQAETGYGRDGVDINTSTIPRNDGTRLNQFLDRLERIQTSITQTLQKIADSLISRLQTQDKRITDITNQHITDLTKRLEVCSTKQSDCLCKLTQQLSSRLQPLSQKTHQLATDNPPLEDYIPATQYGLEKDEYEHEEKEEEKEEETESETTGEESQAYDGAGIPASNEPTNPARDSTPQSALAEMQRWANKMYDSGKEARQNKELLENYRSGKECCDIRVYVRQIGDMLNQLSIVFPNSILSLLIARMNSTKPEEELEEEYEDVANAKWSVVDSAMSIEAPDIEYEDSYDSSGQTVIPYAPAKSLIKAMVKKNPKYQTLMIPLLPEGNKELLEELDNGIR